MTYMGTCKLNPVGIRHYKGNEPLIPGDHVKLSRDPKYAYAVRVDTLAGVQVGHVKSWEGAVLGELLNLPIMQKHLIIDGVIASGGDKFKLPLDAHLQLDNTAQNDEAMSPSDFEAISKVVELLQHRSINSNTRPLILDGEDAAVTFQRKQEMTYMGTCELNLVGIRHYTGSEDLMPGGHVKIVRDHAIRVDNFSGDTVGYVKSQEGRILGQLLDHSIIQKYLVVDGVIPNKGDYYKLPLDVYLYLDNTYQEDEATSQSHITMIAKVVDVLKQRETNLVW